MVGGNGTHYGFRYAGDGTAYEVNPETMPLVRRMFRMVGEEGQSLTAVKTAFERECIPTPKGKTYWNISTVKRVLENDVYLTRPAREVAALVEPEVAEKLDPDKRYGVFWFGKSRQRLTYGRKRKLRITEKDRAEWVAIPVPDCGVPPKWILAARKRLEGNRRWPVPDDPDVRLRGRIRCACGYSMTSIRSDGRRYYVCSQHRKRGRCPHIRFHRLGETEERVERFVLKLLHNPGTLRTKVEEQADRERSVLRNAGREVRRIRSRLDKLEIMEDNYHDQQAEGLISMDRLRSKLASLGEEQADLERRVAELSHSEERLRELDALPQMVEEYLRDLPHLLGLKPVVREYETSAPEPTEGDPLGALYTITSERIRFLPEEELAKKHRAVEEKRARRFRELYAMLNLKVVCHKDRSLEVSWGAHCSEWLGRA